MNKEGITNKEVEDELDKALNAREIIRNDISVIRKEKEFLGVKEKRLNDRFKS